MCFLVIEPSLEVDPGVGFTVDPGSGVGAGAENEISHQLKAIFCLESFLSGESHSTAANDSVWAGCLNGKRFNTNNLPQYIINIVLDHMMN